MIESKIARVKQAVVTNLPLENVKWSGKNVKIDARLYLLQRLCHSLRQIWIISISIWRKMFSYVGNVVMNAMGEEEVFIWFYGRLILWDITFPIPS